MLRLLAPQIVAFALCVVVRADPSAEALLALHTTEARAYRIYRDEAQQERLELQERPVFTWTNLTAEHTQYGHVYVWMYAGRPEAIGTMFSTRGFDPARRAVIHEFHTLSTDRLYPVTPEYSRYQWRPEQGIKFQRLDDSPAVAETAGARLLQMRRLARTFAAESINQEGQRWELRLLPTPALRYEPTSGHVLDGAVFAMVSSAGTDPEVLLLIEARHPGGSDHEWAWHAAALRFSDRDLTITRNQKPVWSSLSDASRRASINSDWTLIETPDKTYSCYRSREVEELPETPAR
jgi:hypothetical protein